MTTQDNMLKPIIQRSDNNTSARNARRASTGEPTCCGIVRRTWAETSNAQNATRHSYEKTKWKSIAASIHSNVQIAPRSSIALHLWRRIVECTWAEISFAQNATRRLHESKIWKGIAGHTKPSVRNATKCSRAILIWRGIAGRSTLSKALHRTARKKATSSKAPI